MYLKSIKEYYCYPHESWKGFILSKCWAFGLNVLLNYEYVKFHSSRSFYNLKGYWKKLKYYSLIVTGENYKQETKKSKVVYSYCAFIFFPSTQIHWIGRRQMGPKTNE